MLIYVSHITNRIKYVMQYVFEEQFGLSYMLCDAEEEFIQKKSEEKIIYSPKNIGGGIYFFSDSFLLEDDIKEINLSSDKINDVAVLFKHNENDALGFDVFAAIFYLLSRYEEYLQKPKDKFGNYDFKNSILKQLNILHVPVVEQWINMLKQSLLNKFPAIQFKSYTAKFALTFDIDVAYEYRNRSIARTIGSLIKKLITFKFPDFKNHVFTLLHFKKDMFDTHQYIFEKIKHNKAIFFLNMGNYGKYDKNPSYKNRQFRNLIKQIHATHLTGIHPSYASNSNHNLIAKEKKKLEEIIDEKITESRQHYLKIKLPNTYYELIKNGIQNDYTIGYHDGYGFRAGTCKSFLFFDLKKNEITNLRLFPFAIMEGTLNDVMKLSIEESKKIISNLISVVCEFKGIFIPLWHNSTLCNVHGWKNWREVFEFMLHEIEKRKLINLFNN